MNDFSSLLDTLGIATGDTVYVHSSFSRLKRFGLTGDAIIDILCNKVGPTGTIAMPSFAWNIIPEQRPWAGYAQYLQSPPRFDVRNTPCNIGWLAEQFRLRPGVLRSAHGFWAICATGNMARQLTTRQELLESPYGAGSAFSLLIEFDAKLLGLGVTLNTSSLCPVADWELGEEHTQEVFTKTPIESEVILTDGVTTVTRTYSMSAESVRRMNPRAMFDQSPQLKSELRFIDLEGDFFYCYPSKTYHLEATRLGRKSIAQGCKMPWLNDLPLKSSACR